MDPATISGLIGVAGTAAATGGSMVMTRRQQKRQNAFNAEQAQIARDFEERMSNTAFQRQVQDMQAAGVNPALMYGGAGSSGASTPSGNPASAAGNFDALQGALAIKQMGLIDAQKEKTLAEAELTSRDSAWKDRLNEQTLRESASRILVNEAEINAREYDNALKEAETALRKKEFQWFDRQASADIGLKGSQTAYHKAEAAISQLERQLGHRLSSSELLALTDSILSLIGGSNPISTAAGKGVINAARRASSAAKRATGASRPSSDESAGLGGRTIERSFLAGRPKAPGARSTGRGRSYGPRAAGGR